MRTEHSRSQPNCCDVRVQQQRVNKLHNIIMMYVYVHKLLKWNYQKLQRILLQIYSPTFIGNALALLNSFLKLFCLIVLLC